MSTDAYTPAQYHYERTPYRRAGRSGLLLPPISLGMWQNFGAERDPETLRTIVLRAFDLGITHFDLANNYGPPPGSAEKNFGEIMRKDLMPYRDELVISSKAGFDMWDGPYGKGGSRKHMLASLDQSLQRLGLEYVDIFYHHCEDPDTPIEESMSALAHAVHTGKALYVGVSNYSPENTQIAAEILADMGVRLTMHQPSFSMFNRWIEEGLLETAAELGIGLAAFSPLQQGLLTNRYMSGVPQSSRAASSSTSLTKDQVNDPLYQERVRGLNDIANQRGQSLAQLALAWALRHEQVTTALVGASSVNQLEQNVDTLENLEFTDQELAAIDEFAIDGTAARN